MDRVIDWPDVAEELEESFEMEDVAAVHSQQRVAMC